MEAHSAGGALLMSSSGLRILSAGANLFDAAPEKTAARNFPAGG